MKCDVGHQPNDGNVSWGVNTKSPEQENQHLLRFPNPEGVELKF
jgi:hypothetical protein